MNMRNDEYPSVHTWSILSIEGYCMLNMDYGACKDPYSYLLKPDGSFERVKNDNYDPSACPESWPAGCTRSVSPHCIGCRHFGWCEAARSGRKRRHVSGRRFLR